MKNTDKKNPGKKNTARVISRCYHFYAAKLPPHGGRRGCRRGDHAEHVARSADNAAGANERLGVGFIGTGADGVRSHIDIVNKLKEAGRVEPVAVCDVYGPRVRAAAEQTGGKIYRHYQELLARSEGRCRLHRHARSPPRAPGD